jgi:hypothetical protein
MNESPDLSAVFGVLNEMLERKILSKYAVGGAVAAIFYIEPRETFDLDIFFVLASEPSNQFTRLEAIYDFASEKGFDLQSEFIKISGWAVQFLESETPLWKEAVENAVKVKFENTLTFVINPEYLAAMMVEVGRSKDWIRLSDFFSAGVLNVEIFKNILQKHGLMEKWNKGKWRLEDV